MQKASASSTGSLQPIRTPISPLQLCWPVGSMESRIGWMAPGLVGGYDQPTNPTLELLKTLWRCADRFEASEAAKAMWENFVQHYTASPMGRTRVSKAITD